MHRLEKMLIILCFCLPAFHAIPTWAKTYQASDIKSVPDYVLANQETYHFTTFQTFLENAENPVILVTGEDAVAAIEAMDGNSITILDKQIVETQGLSEVFTSLTNPEELGIEVYNMESRRLSNITLDDLSDVWDGSEYVWYQGTLWHVIEQYEIVGSYADHNGMIYEGSIDTIWTTAASFGFNLPANTPTAQRASILLNNEFSLDIKGNLNHAVLGSGTGEYVWSQAQRQRLVNEGNSIVYMRVEPVAGKNNVYRWRKYFRVEKSILSAPFELHQYSYQLPVVEYLPQLTYQENTRNILYQWDDDENPEVPVTPEVPVVPEEPTTPDKPKTPTEPSVPEEPALPKEPKIAGHDPEEPVEEVEEPPLLPKTFNEEPSEEPESPTEVEEPATEVPDQLLPETFAPAQETSKDRLPDTSRGMLPRTGEDKGLFLSLLGVGLLLIVATCKKVRRQEA